MNSILVATDFSPSANNAVDYAAGLAQSLGTGLLLLHVYQIPISMSDVPVLMVSAEELRNNADMGLKNIEESLNRNYPGLNVQTESRLGDIVGEINEICEGKSPFAVVVGKHGVSGVERFLFGSTALSVIRSTSVPVITVPDDTKSFRLKKIALASDGSPLGAAEEKIREFVRKTNAELHIVHVRESGQEGPAIDNILQDLNPVCKTLTSEDFSDAITEFLENNQIDMLLILPHKHSLMERMLFKTHTAELVKKIPYPVMTIEG